MGWNLVKYRRGPGVADLSDLSQNGIVKWQHRHYVQLILVMGFIVPTVMSWPLFGTMPQVTSCMLEL